MIVKPSDPQILQASVIGLGEPMRNNGILASNPGVEHSLPTGVGAVSELSALLHQSVDPCANTVPYLHLYT